LKVSSPYFVVQNYHRHAKDFLRNLYKIWTRALKNFPNSCLGEKRIQCLSYPSDTAEQPAVIYWTQRLQKAVLLIPTL